MFAAALVAAALLAALIIGILIMHKPAPSPSDVVRMRACPVCGRELKIGENILAERTGVVKEGRERIIIKGCVHCLKKV